LLLYRPGRVVVDAVFVLVVLPETVMVELKVQEVEIKVVKVATVCEHGVSL